MVAILRIFGGNQAPDWAKNIGGAPVQIQRNSNGCANPGHCPITVGRVWSTAYRAAWRNLQEQVAAQFDNEPLIRAVAVTSCSMQTDEPFIPTTDQASRGALVAAGYTDALGKACLLGAIEDYGAWSRTVIDYTLDPFYDFSSSPSLGLSADISFTESVMSACRSAIGARCELDNHSLSSAATNADAIEGVISQAGAPIHFQTAAPGSSSPGFAWWLATAQKGIGFNASGIELWPDARFNGFMTLSVVQVRQLHELFIAHRGPPPPPHCSTPPSCCALNGGTWSGGHCH